MNQEINLPIFIIMGDINGLKLVNDTFGHDKGDMLLKEAASVIQSACRVDELLATRGHMINTIINTLHEKNPREEDHSKRVSELCQEIGRVMGLSDLEVNKLKVSGLLHNIGKIALEETVLNKPDKLSDEEWAQIKRHHEIGYRILCSSFEMLELADCILAHHERWDGTGYPKGLKDEAIPLNSRIIAIADSYDAMTSKQPYRNLLSREIAIEEIRKNAGTQFDPEIAKIFIEKVYNTKAVTIEEF